MSVTRKFALVIALSFIVIIAGSFAVGYGLTKPINRSIGKIPSNAPFEQISFSGHEEISLSGWLLKSETPKGAVLLLHGVRSDRRDMVSRAKFLWRSGYSVMLYDSRAHGESEGNQITFGYLESLDAEKAFARLKYEVPNVPIGIIGMSLGGAASLLGEAAELADALVLEAVYPTLEQALNNRLSMRLGRSAPLAKPLLLGQVQLRLGVNPSWFSPIERIRSVNTPVLVVGGTLDQHTTPEQTKELYAAARSQKELYFVEGAAHVNFHREGKSEYESRLLSFLNRHLAAGI